MSGVGGSLVHTIFREGVRTPFLWLQGYVPSPFYEREELEKRLILASKAPSEKIITFFEFQTPPSYGSRGMSLPLFTNAKSLKKVNFGVEGAF